MSKRILIVDDSRVARMILSRVIHEIDADWVISEAASGTEAVEHSKQNNPGAVILDFSMPGMDGLDTARQLRDFLPNTPITLLTANIQKSIEKEAEKIGIGFLTKPVKKDEIAAFLGG